MFVVVKEWRNVRYAPPSTIFWRSNGFKWLYKQRTKVVL